MGLLGGGSSSSSLLLSLGMLLVVRVRLGRVNPGTVLWEVLMAVHGVIGHHLDGGWWSCVVAPRDAVLRERRRLRNVGGICRYRI